MIGYFDEKELMHHLF